MIVEKPTILICNDDGVNAPGLRYLIETVSEFGNVIAVAPADHRSGQSSAITIGEPLRIVRHADIGKAEVYSVTGTPVDCIKLALHTIVAGRKISLMLSGINHGSNAGTCVVYSGTKGAAIATDISMTCSMVFVMVHFFRPESNLRFTRGIYRLRWRIITGIIGIGAAPSLVNLAGSAINVIVNKTLYAYGSDNAVAAAGI